MNYKETYNEMKISNQYYPRFLPKLVTSRSGTGVEGLAWSSRVAWSSWVCLLALFALPQIIMISVSIYLQRRLILFSNASEIAMTPGTLFKSISTDTCRSSSIVGTNGLARKSCNRCSNRSRVSRSLICVALLPPTASTFTIRLGSVRYVILPQYHLVLSWSKCFHSVTFRIIWPVGVHEQDMIDSFWQSGPYFIIQARSLMKFTSLRVRLR